MHPMYELFHTGQEVSFPGLPDIRLIIISVDDHKGNLRCKYYDDHLQKYITLTLSADALSPVRKPSIVRRQ